MVCLINVGHTVELTIDDCGGFLHNFLKKNGSMMSPDQNLHQTVDFLRRHANRCEKSFRKIR